MFEKESGYFVGEGGLHHLRFDDTQPEIEINYHLHTEFWGKGYGTELTKSLVRWGFENLSIDKIVASTCPDNIASQKVLKKAGFDCRGEKHPSNGNTLLWYEIYKNDAIELVPYNSEWSKMAEIEIQKLSEILPKNNVIDIQHVGSTAIPGLISKPIIDIQIAVDSLAAIKSIAIDTLEALGYVYWDENPDTERMFFVKGMPPFGDKRTHHVHIVEQTSHHWKEKNLFRDYLLTHPEAAEKYMHLKKELAGKYTYDREQYTEAKTTFIREILKMASDTIK